MAQDKHRVALVIDVADAEVRIMPPQDLYLNFYYNFFYILGII